MKLKKLFSAVLSLVVAFGIFAAPVTAHAATINEVKVTVDSVPGFTTDDSPAIYLANMVTKIHVPDDAPYYIDDVVILDANGDLATDFGTVEDYALGILLFPTSGEEFDTSNIKLSDDSSDGLSILDCFYDEMAILLDIGQPTEGTTPKISEIKIPAAIPAFEPGTSAYDYADAVGNLLALPSYNSNNKYWFNDFDVIVMPEGGEWNDKVYPDYFEAGSTTNLNGDPVAWDLDDFSIAIAAQMKENAGVKFANANELSFVDHNGNRLNNVKVVYHNNQYTEGPQLLPTIVFTIPISPVGASAPSEPAPTETAPAASATHAHLWGYNTQFDAAAHWDHCQVCGAKNTPVAHSDADGNGFCVCGWPMASTPSRVNPDTGVTADMLK